MIANISQGSFITPLIDYHEKKIKQGKAQVLAYSNILSPNSEYAKKLFLEYTSSSKRKDRFFHVSLNIPSGDGSKVSDQTFQHIASDYLKELGFDTDHPTIIYKHTDTEHPHIHLVTSKILANGKVINDAHLHRRSQRITRSLELKYNLTVVNSTKQSPIASLDLNVTNSFKSQLSQVLQYGLDTQRLTTIEELQELLKSNNFEIEVSQGYSNQGELFYATLFHKLENNKTSSSSIKASSLYRSPTISNLQKIFAKNKAYHKLRRKDLQKDLKGLLQNYSHINYQDFNKLLLPLGLLYNPKFDSANKLVGGSFTDITTSKHYTGEKMGVAFKAASLRSLLGSNPTRYTSVGYTKAQLNLFSLKPLSLKDDVSKDISNLLYLGFQPILKDGKVLIVTQNNESTKPSFIEFGRYDVEKEASLKSLIQDFRGIPAKLQSIIIAYTKGSNLGDKAQISASLKDYKEYLKENRPSEKVSFTPLSSLDTLLKGDDTFDPNISDADRKKRKRGKKRKL